MRQIYTAVEGDTFESVSERFYGNDAHAEFLAAANGSWDNTLAPGQMLVIPPR